LNISLWHFSWSRKIQYSFKYAVKRNGKNIEVKYCHDWKNVDVDDVDVDFKAEINKQLNEIRTKKQLNMLTMRIDSLNANFNAMFLTMTKNPFKEKNIVFSGLTENNESYEIFRKEVSFIMKNDPAFMYLSNDDKDKLMGKSVISGLAGAPKSTVDLYYQQQDVKQEPYKWSEIDLLLQKYKNKNGTITSHHLLQCNR